MEYLIATLLKKHGQRSWSELQRRIERANEFRIRNRRGSDPERRITIDRRKLKELADGDPDVALSRYELELLDRFLISYEGFGLAEQPIFERRSLFGELYATEKIAFYLGVRWNEALRTDFIPRWDVSAQNAIKDRISAQVETETIEVAVRDAGRPQLGSRKLRQIHQQAPNRIAVSIASPATAASSEYLLAEMFGVHPNRIPEQPLPIRFVHPTSVEPSAFSERPPAGGRSGGESLWLDGEEHAARQSRDYGVIACARTSADTAAFVVAGNTGPATYGAALHLANDAVTSPLPEFVPDGRQPVMITLVEVQIRKIGNTSGMDNRMISEVSTVDAPRLFQTTGDGWTPVSQPADVPG
jgi:hypothetical protein